MRSRDPKRDRRSGAWSRTDVETGAQDRRAFTHPGQAQPALPGRAVEANAVVADLNPDLRWAHRRVEPYIPRAAVTSGVAECCLDDPIRVELTVGGQQVGRHDRGIEAHLDLDTGAAGQVPQRRAQANLGDPRRPETGGHIARLLERSPRELLGMLERRPGAGRDDCTSTQVGIRSIEREHDRG
jgi:hypothetical protein